MTVTEGGGRAMEKGVQIRAWFWSSASGLLVTGGWNEHGVGTRTSPVFCLWEAACDGVTRRGRWWGDSCSGAMLKAVFWICSIQGSCETSISITVFWKC